MRSSLANNHLSESALGRFGDTEMYKTSPSGPGKGKEWHVNPEEKQLMNMYGAEGEKLVDSIGSGTINPYTGKEEKFLGMTWAAVTGAAAIGSALVGAYSAWKGGSNAKEQASAEEASARSGLEELDNAEANMEKSVQAKREAGMLDYRQDVKKLSAETGVSKEDLQEQTNVAIQKSGLVTSGEIDKKKSTIWERIEQSSGFAQEGLIAGLGKQMGDIEGWYEGEKARIASERNKFNNQIEFAEEKQKGFFG
tara:strand:+ start:117 stop:872 length:756 start_codon:yes stop_codon:yes gene_type:complete